jgi:hypothetical protein
MQWLRVGAWPAGFAALMAGLCALYFSVGGVLAPMVVSVLLTVLPGVAIAAGVRLHRPSHPLPWLLLALAQLPSAVGIVLLVREDRVLGGHIPLPIPADFIQLGTYVLPIAALITFLTARRRTRDLPSLLDALIVTCGVGALAWVFLIAPGAFAGRLSVLGRVVAVGVPLMDVLMLALLVRLLLDLGRRTPAFGLLTSAVAVMLGCDAYVSLARLNGTFTTDSPIVGGYVLYGVLLGTSALLPSRINRPRMAALLALASLATPAVIALQKLTGQPIDVGTVLVAAALLCALAMLRLGTLVQALQRVMAQNEWWAQRETILREAAAALVAEQSEERILAVAVGTADRLLAGAGTAHVTRDAPRAGDLVLALPLPAPGALVVTGAAALVPQVTEALRTLAAQVAPSPRTCTVSSTTSTSGGSWRTPRT